MPPVLHILLVIMVLFFDNVRLALKVAVCLRSMLGVVNLTALFFGNTPLTLGESFLPQQHA